MTLWLVLITAGYFVPGKEVFRLIKLIRSSMLIGFSTASIESAYPNSASSTGAGNISVPHNR